MLGRILLLLALTLPLLAPTSAWARDTVQRIEPVLRDGMLLVEADIHLDPSGELREAAERGLPLYFTADLELRRQRWWWFDQILATVQRTWRIQFNALTRQWRVGTGTLSLPASSLDEALDLVRHLRGWEIIALDELDTDTEYTGRLRMRLDTSHLARPFQVNALNSNAWSLTTPWKSFSFSISVDAPQP